MALTYFRYIFRVNGMSLIYMLYTYDSVNIGYTKIYIMWENGYSYVFQHQKANELKKKSRNCPYFEWSFVETSWSRIVF